MSGWVIIKASKFGLSAARLVGLYYCSRILLTADFSLNDDPPSTPAYWIDPSTPIVPTKLTTTTTTKAPSRSCPQHLRKKSCESFKNDHRQYILIAENDTVTPTLCCYGQTCCHSKEEYNDMVKCEDDQHKRPACSKN